MSKDFKYVVDQQPDGLWIAEVIGVPETVFCAWEKPDAIAGAAALAMKRIADSAEEDIARLERDILRINALAEFFAEASVLVLVFVPIEFFKPLADEKTLWALPMTLIVCILMFQYSVGAKHKGQRLQRTLELIKSLKSKDLKAEEEK